MGVRLYVCLGNSVEPSVHLSVEYKCIRICHIHGEQIFWFEVLIEIDIFNQVEGMGAVFDVCW